MEPSKILLKPIGVIHTSFTNYGDAPFQGTYYPKSQGTAEIFKEYKAGLKDLDNYSNAIFIYLFNRSKDWKPMVIPHFDNKLRGLFSTRAPHRPNPLGMTVVKLLSIDKNIITFSYADMLDGTPLLDIKPFIPKIDCPKVGKLGWIEKYMDTEHNHKADKNKNR